MNADFRGSAVINKQGNDPRQCDQNPRCEQVNKWCKSGSHVHIIKLERTHARMDVRSSQQGLANRGNEESKRNNQKRSDAKQDFRSSRQLVSSAAKADHLSCSVRHG